VRKSVVATVAVGILAATSVMTQISAAEATGRGRGGSSLNNRAHSHRISTERFRPVTLLDLDHFVSHGGHFNSILEIRGIPTSDPGAGFQAKTVERLSNGRISVTNGYVDDNQAAVLARTADRVILNDKQAFLDWFQNWRASMSERTVGAKMYYDSNADSDKENGDSGPGENPNINPDPNRGA